MAGLVRTFLRNRWFYAGVVAPTILAALYYGLIASDVYVSESRFVIKSPSQRSAQVSTLANLIQTTGLSSGQEQSNEVMDYIRSRSAMASLRRIVPLEQFYGRTEVDFLSRYPLPFRQRADENLFKYYKKMTSVGLDHDTGVVVLRVNAFRPADAHDLNEKLLGISEQLVNELNRRAQAKGIAEAETRVREAQGRVERARIALRGYRNKEQLLDPGKQATGVFEVANRLESERAGLVAQIEQVERFAPGNPSLPSLKARLAAISREIAAQSGRAMGTTQGIATKLTGYENLLAEQEFASQSLTAANASLEQAHLEAFRQQFYVERVVTPNTPDLPELPHRIQTILTVFASSLCLYLVGWMFLVGVLEHAPED